MGKREDFWRSIRGEDGKSIVWPESLDERKALASRMLGASIVGALESIVHDALGRAGGAPPPADAQNREALERDAEVLRSLSTQQRDVVRRLLRETAYLSLYWPLVKASTVPGAALNLTITPTRGEHEAATSKPLVLTEFFGLQVLFLQWVDEFAEVIDRESHSPPSADSG